MRALLAFGLLLSSCAVVQKVDNAIDCDGICQKYHDCFDTAYDVSACALRCRDKSSEDKEFRRKADLCNACIGERSCVGATFSCVADCASVVP